MATVLLAGTVVLQSTVIASGDGDHALSSSASTSSPLTGIDLNGTLGLYTLTSASAPFSLTEQTTIIGPTEDVDGNALTWSHQVVSSSGSTHQVQFVAEDGSGNSATLTFTFESETIPSGATVTEEFSVSQTSNSFVVTPPVFEVQELTELAPGMWHYSHFDNYWTVNNVSNTTVEWRSSPYPGHVRLSSVNSYGSMEPAAYMDIETGTNGQSKNFIISADISASGGQDIGILHIEPQGDSGNNAELGGYIAHNNFDTFSTTITTSSPTIRLMIRRQTADGGSQNFKNISVIRQS